MCWVKPHHVWVYIEMKPELCSFRGEYWTISALEAVKKIRAIYWPPLGEPKMLTYNYVFFILGNVLAH